MHELAICQALIGQVERVARDNCARQVVGVVVAIGPLAGVEAKLLEHAYPLAAAGTIAEHATLTIESVPLVVRCRTCRRETEAASNRVICAVCHDWQVEVISGEELLLRRVEIETTDAAVH